MIVADFRREYRINADDLYDLPTQEFLWLLAGLSSASAWRQVTAAEPVEVTTQDAQALISSL
ncbi:MAG: hypothetical protein ACRDOV_02395 [Streptomyces sp.]